ncbi:MAG: M15 family metallopeptidase [Candidatus Moraniibacteriota bacterium]
MKLEFVDLKNYSFILEPKYYFYGWSRSGKILARKSVAEKLVEAKKYLPRGYNFKIWDCKRTLATQILMLESFRKRLKSSHSKLSKKQIEELVWTFGAKPVRKVERLDVHRNGGSIDLTIVNQKGEELYMGTEFDDLTEKAATDYFEKKKNLNLLKKEARKNRGLLKRIMKKAGFINYDLEWWHWSYDK